MSAIFSFPDRTHRYRLDRELAGDAPPVAFALHNPSIAGADNEDATSRRGIGFANAWGARRLTYINFAAGVATDKADLWAMRDPFGPFNENHIETVAREIAAEGGFVVAAWGSVKPSAYWREETFRRIDRLCRIVAETGCEMMCLGTNADLSPKHPLYVLGATEPIPYRLDV